MKIGFFTDTYRPQINGVVENVDATAEALRKRGHKVYIFAPKINGFKDKDKNVIRLDSVRVIKNPEHRLAVPLPTQGFRDMVRVDLDIVHAHAGGTLSLLGYQLAVVKGIPFIFTYHTLFTEYIHYILKGKVITPQMVKQASRVFCNLTDTVVVPSTKIYKELATYKVTKPIVVIPGGVGEEKFSKSEPGFLHNLLKLAMNQKIILFTGRLGKEKNLPFLIRMFKVVAAKNKDCVLVFVGDGPERADLEKIAHYSGVRDRIFFTGFLEQKNLPSVYQDSDVFVFSSRSETQGLVVAEALANSLPVVALKDEAIGEMVESGSNGFLTSTQREFSQKVQLLLQNAALREELGTAGAKLIRRKFTAAKQAGDLENLYQQLILEQKKNPRRLNQLTKKISSVYNFLNTATLVTVWKSLVNKF